MSPYPGPSLLPGGDNIRLLRLLPSDKEAAPLQCELRSYSLQKLGPRTHLYEALSYAWGNPDETLPICVGKVQFQVTVNLHAALSHLRDHSLERIIWVDAICINQENPEERKQQVQLMAKIYSKAHRVIVWLGKGEVDTERALEDIRLAADDESTEHSKKEINREAILKLLQRPWFQRIWVLQEVAAARHIVIMYGSMEIDGYAFCLGLKSLNLSYTDYPAFPELQTLPSVTYLIERASLRSKHITDSPKSFSLEIRHLVELIDMFHTRGASDNRDKVYALLGMSSDNPGEAGLQPDYRVSWRELFQQLVEFILGKGVSVETFDHSQRAVIKSKGCVLGQVSSVRSGDRQNVNITSKNAAWYSGDKREWILHASAKSIQEHDIVCLLQGASKPTIIRLCKDHFAIVVIAATPLNESGSFRWPQLSRSIINFPRDFSLVWDWENPLGELQDQEEYKTLTKTISRVLERSKAELRGHLDRAVRNWDVAIILDDLDEYEKADERLQEAIEDYEMAFGVDHPYKLKGQHGRTPLSWAAGNGYDVVANPLLAKASIDPDLKDYKSGRTPLSWAAEGGHEAMVKLLLETGMVDVESQDENYRTPLSWAAEGGHEAVVKLLLEKGAELETKDNYGRTPLSWAAEGGHEAVVKLLLEKGAELETKDNYGRTPLSWAAKGGYEAVVKLLLEKGAELETKDENDQTPLSWAAKEGYKAVVKLLLEKGAELETKDNYNRTPLSWAAKGGYEAVVKLLLEKGTELETKDNNDRTPLSWAVGKGHEAVVKLLLEKGAELETKDENDRTPLSWAAKGGYEAVVKLLLEKGAELETKDKNDQTPLSWTAKGGYEAVVKLLLEKGAELETEDKDYGRTPLSWAVEGGHEAVVKLLLEKGAELETKDKNDRTPLLWTVKEGHEAVVKLLLEKGAELETEDKDYGRTPLLWAVGGGHEAVVKLLLEKGAELETKDKDYDQTPLLWAVGKGHEAVVKLLLEKGAELETKDKYYDQTPLSWAAKEGYKAVVKLLLEKGAELETKDNYNRTPLSWAAEEGHEAVVKLLLEKGAELETKDKDYGWTPLSWAAEEGHEAVVKLLLDKGAELETKDKNDQTPLSWAAGNGHEAMVKLLLEKGAEKLQLFTV